MKPDFSFEVGDLLHRPKGVVQHAGVYVGRGHVLHIQPGGTVEVVPLCDFADGKAISVSRLPFQVKAGFQERVAEVVQQGASYCLFSNNCEHIAYYLVAGERKSPQLQAAIIFGIAGGLLSSGRKMSDLMFTAGLIGFGALLLSNANRRCEFVLEAS